MENVETITREASESTRMVRWRKRKGAGKCSISTFALQNTLQSTDGKMSVKRNIWREKYIREWIEIWWEIDWEKLWRILSITKTGWFLIEKKSFAHLPMSQVAEFYSLEDILYNKTSNFFEIMLSSRAFSPVVYKKQSVVEENRLAYFEKSLLDKVFE